MSDESENLSLVPVTLAQANEFVRRLHRHYKPVVGHRFSVGVTNGLLRGVAIAGRPVARMLDDGLTIEITRVCTDGHANACSMLYGAACRAAKALGYKVAITYTLGTESGASLRAAGFVMIAKTKDAQWSRPSRPREQRDLIGDKVRWERKL